MLSSAPPPPSPWPHLVDLAQNRNPEIVQLKESWHLTHGKVKRRVRFPRKVLCWVDGNTGISQLSGQYNSHYSFPRDKRDSDFLRIIFSMGQESLPQHNTKKVKRTHGHIIQVGVDVDANLQILFLLSVGSYHCNNDSFNPTMSLDDKMKHTVIWSLRGSKTANLYYVRQLRTAAPWPW